ncbi:D-alanyl-D-alanine carboxypeptidase [Leptolyngbya ohadii]|uniref:D-alanyl-D-alanine carboxypeptidase n=1 Tax=Leptolyngbya ohadii TaxID=1962290 RepID=UPI001CEC06F9|nr:D-alanyl-D-alanine carboxypeptidase [Leptolyngbya ohadii]
MLDLFHGLLSLFFQQQEPKVQLLRSSNLSPWLDTVWVRSATVRKPDPQAELAMRTHLAALGALNLRLEGQGVWIQAGNEILAEHQGITPLPAASLTKTATTLAALETWGIDHRFETLVSAAGSIENGVLKGDLVVQGGGDPFFVWEEAIVLGNALRQKGIRQVTGNLIVSGNFAMNFEADPVKSGSLLKQGLDANRWSAEVSTQYSKLPPGTDRPQIRINGTVLVNSPEQIQAKSLTPLVRHQSLPMVDILKAMNIYSNNIMSEMMAQMLGGAAGVTQKVLQATQIPPEEIQIFNGSGLGEENRLSPRAVAAILIATQRYLQPRQLTVADIYPIQGRDWGTLKWREMPNGSAVKTGTLDAVSSLAGVIPTRDRGLVWFTIINLGTGDLGEFHRQQDRLLQRLQQSWGAPNPLPPAIQPSDRSRPSASRLGAAERNEIL